jgi:hypothetical protein
MQLTINDAMQECEKEQGNFRSRSCLRVTAAASLEAKRVGAAQFLPSNAPHH